MTTTRYLALLRGINVGGSNIIKMADLKECFEKCKLRNVETFIQSGNVIFESAAASPATLVKKLEKAVSGTFRPYQARIVVCSHSNLERIVREAPRGFGQQPEKYRYDVIFLKEPLTATEALQDVTTKSGVDAAHAGPGVMYFSRLIARASQSRLSRLIQLPVYQHMTIRNWNTTCKLLAKMAGRTQR